MLNDILQFFTALIDALHGFIDLTVQIFTGLVGFIRWAFVSIDVSQELVQMVPWDIGTMFMAMALISVLFVIFGRIK